MRRPIQLVRPMFIALAGVVLIVACEERTTSSITYPASPPMRGQVPHELQLDANTTVTGSAHVVVENYDASGRLAGRQSLLSWHFAARMIRGSASDDASGGPNTRAPLTVAEGVAGHGHGFGRRTERFQLPNGHLATEMRTADGDGPTASQLLYDGDQLVAGISRAWTAVPGGWILNSMSIIVYRNGRPGQRITLTIDSADTHSAGLVRQAIAGTADELGRWLLPKSADAMLAYPAGSVGAADEKWCVAEFFVALGAVLVVPEVCAVTIGTGCIGAVISAIGAIYNFDVCMGMIQPT